MQAVYLIRHGEPNFKNGKCALGRLDLDLSKNGFECLSKLKPAYFSIPDKHVFTSPLKRAISSAIAAGADEYTVIPNLYELDLGVWDGLTFSEIKERWPDEYEKRGQDLASFEAPGGEKLTDCRRRVSKAFKNIMEEYKRGNIFVFSHNAVAKMIMSDLCQIDIAQAFKTPYNYGDSIQFIYDEAGNIGTYIGEMRETPDRSTCLKLLEEAKTPKHVIEHTEAVADKAVKICERMNANGYSLDQKFVYAASLLHDIKRVEKKHALAGAKFLLERGYGSIAAAVGDHMDLPASEMVISEKSLVFLADKLVKQDKEVSLEDRYFKDKTEEQLAFSRVKYKNAKIVYELYKAYLA